MRLRRQTIFRIASLQDRDQVGSIHMAHGAVGRRDILRRFDHRHGAVCVFSHADLDAAFRLGPDRLHA